MVYADVVVGIRGSSEKLTYTVPAKIIPYIRVGSLVIVPVRKKLTKAVVIKLHQRVDSTLKERIREIYSIDKTHPGISEAQLNTVSGLAKRYLTNESDIIFRLLSSIRPISVSTNPPGKINFVQGVWEQRINYYQKATEKYQETLIIFPTYAHRDDFIANYRGENSLVVLNDTAASRRKVFEANSPVIFLGTVGDSFFPLKKSALMIVDQPTHIGSSYANRPFLSAYDIANERSKTEGLDLLSGQTIVSFSQLQASKTEGIAIKTLDPTTPTVTVSSRIGSSGILLDSLKEKVISNLQEKRSMVVFVASKGWSSAVFCRNCQQLLNCPNCQRVIGANQNELACRFCGQVAHKPNYCLNCQRAELVELGEGIDKFIEYFKTEFAQSSLQVIVGKTKELKSGIDITLTTEKILSFPWAKFDSLIVASADQALAGSSLDDSWHLLNVLKEIAGRVEQITIQTYLPDHPVWSALNPQNLRQYFVDELNARRKYRLPPYTHELGLFGQHSSQTSLKQQVEALEQVINRKLPTVEYTSSIYQTSQGNFQATIKLIVPKSVSLLANNVLGSAILPNWTAIPG